MFSSPLENLEETSTEITAIQAAVRFRTTEETKSFDADFDFLFTRSIEFRQETI